MKTLELEQFCYDCGEPLDGDGFCALCSQADEDFQRMAYGGTVSELRREYDHYFPDEARWEG